MYKLVAVFTCHVEPMHDLSVPHETLKRPEVSLRYTALFSAYAAILLISYDIVMLILCIAHAHDP